MNYDLIATLGPTSQTPVTWKEMLDAGATAFRLNTSHLSIQQLQGWLEALDAFQKSRGDLPLSIFLDLQGSKWRLGEFETFELIPGQEVELVYAQTTDKSGSLPVPHLDVFKAAGASRGELVINDAKNRLAVELVEAERIVARVRLGGEISARKGITFTDCEFRSEALADKDRTIWELTGDIPGIRYAISYVKDAVEMANYRALFGPTAYLAAKLERRPAVDEATEVAVTADEIWLCRGDLGAELGLAGMAESAARFSATVTNLPVRAIMAGQVLEHMTARPTPTRSEVCYIYDSLTRGYAGFVLSDETAIGPHPVESCRIAAMFQ